MSKYMTPVLVLVLAVLAITLAYKGPVVLTAMAAYADREFNVTTGNVAPIVNAVTCYDQTNGASASATLNAFSNITVLCNATVSDDEGCQDYNGTLGGNSLKGEFYATSRPCGADNSKNCYNNASCVAVGSCTALKNQTVECRYTVQFNANNTTWTGWINVSDSHGLWSNASDTIPMNNLITLNVTNNSITMGTLTAGQNTSTHTKGIEVQNGGNVIMDLNLNGTSNFTCATKPDIAIGNLTYDLTTGTAYGAGTALTTTATALSSFNLASAAGGAGFPAATTKLLYWGMGVPLYTVGGQTCSATIRVAAIIDQ